VGAFPPLVEPVKLIKWLAEAHTGRMFAYPIGGAQGASSFTTLCFAAALIALWRKRETTLLLLAIGPFGIAFLAAALGRYPYGGSARTMLFLAPTICLLSAVGLADLIARVRPREARQWALRTVLAALFAFGVVLLGLKLGHPYKDISDENSRAFARWFWTEKARDAELVCVKSDLGNGFDHRNWSLFRSALYLCNQKIYSPRHRHDAPVNWIAISAARPLRCVLYNEWPENNPACAAWVAGMSRHYRVMNRETFVMNKPGHRDNGTDVEDRYTVYEFVAKDAAQALGAMHGGSSEALRR
jgi:hypothetical protein